MACGLFELMEQFILDEIDYSQKYGYSSRAKRYMRRKLNKELAPYISTDVLEDIASESDNSDNSGCENDSNEYCNDYENRPVKFCSAYNQEHANACFNLYMTIGIVSVCVSIFTSTLVILDVYNNSIITTC